MVAHTHVMNVPRSTKGAVGVFLASVMTLGCGGQSGPVSTTPQSSEPDPLACDTLAGQYIDISGAAGMTRTEFATACKETFSLATRTCYSNAKSRESFKACEEIVEKEAEDSSELSDKDLQRYRAMAQALAVQVLAERQIYTKSIIMKAKAEGIPIIPSPTYETVAGAVPLPATFVHKVSSLINKNRNATHSIDLLSLWNINPNKGPRDPFEKEGLRQVAAHPDQIYEGIETNGEIRRYRAIIADIATVDACADCHNKHPKSPKRDFQKHDVMGGILITIPIRSKDLE
jgi:hypothetical protein